MELNMKSCIIQIQVHILEHTLEIMSFKPSRSYLSSYMSAQCYLYENQNLWYYLCQKIRENSVEFP